MSSNQTFDRGIRLPVVCSNGGALSGDPARYGTLTGVALADKRASDNITSVDFGQSAWNLSVKAINDYGNSAVAVGDQLYYVDGDTPKISKKASGFFFGYALSALNSGATGTINVLNAMPAGKVTGTGILPLPLGQWRLLATNDIAAIAASGGILAKDTTPILERVNVATDKQQRIRWAATGVGEIAIGGIMAPPDLDISQPVAFKMYGAMGGATDHPSSTVSMFEGVGGTDLGGALPAMAGGTTPAVYSLNIAAVTAGWGSPKPWSFGFTPAAHGTDTLLVYAMWLEYTRK